MIRVLSEMFQSPPVPRGTPRCQHSVLMAPGYQTEWRKGVFDRKIRRYARSERVDQCTFNSVVEIDGVPLCRRHAGFLVLEMYVNGKLVDAK